MPGNEFDTLLRARDGIALKRVAARELIGAAIERIGQLDPKLHAFNEVHADQFSGLSDHFAGEVSFA